MWLLMMDHDDPSHRLTMSVMSDFPAPLYSSGEVQSESEGDYDGPGSGFGLVESLSCAVQEAAQREKQSAAAAFVGSLKAEVDGESGYPPDSSRQSGAGAGAGADAGLDIVLNSNLISLGSRGSPARAV